MDGGSYNKYAGQRTVEEHGLQRLSARSLMMMMMMMIMISLNLYSRAILSNHLCFQHNRTLLISL